MAAPQKNRLVMAAQRRRVSTYRQVAKEVAAEARAKNDRVLWRASRDLLAIAAEEEAAAPAPAAPVTAPGGDEEAAARQELQDALDADKMDDAQAAFAKIRRARAKARMRAAAQDVGPAQAPVAPAPAPVAPPQADPSLAAPMPVFSSTDRSALRGIIARVHRTNPDVARKLRQALRA